MAESPAGAGVYLNDEDAKKLQQGIATISSAQFKVQKLLLCVRIVRAHMGLICASAKDRNYDCRATTVWSHTMIDSRSRTLDPIQDDRSKISIYRSKMLDPI